MALTDPDTIAGQIQSDIAGLGVVAGTAITDAQIKGIWKAVVTRIYNDLQANAQVDVGTFTSTAPGSPIAGVGGPIS